MVKAFDFNGLLRGKRINHYHAGVHKRLKSSRKILLVILAVVSILHTVNAQKKVDATASPFNSQAYRVGERLTYDVSFSQFVSAAHVELFVAARGTFFGREAIQLRGHTETTGVVNVALFAINNDYTTYIDPASGLPFRAQEVVRAAGRTADSSSDYNESAGTAAVPSRLRNGEFPGTYDLLSAVYRARALPLAAGASYIVSVRYEAEEYQAEIKVTGRENIKTKVGSFNAIATRLNVSKSKLNDCTTRFRAEFFTGTNTSGGGRRPLCSSRRWRNGQ